MKWVPSEPRLSLECSPPGIPCVNFSSCVLAFPWEFWIEKLTKGFYSHICPIALNRTLTRHSQPISPLRTSVFPSVQWGQERRHWGCTMAPPAVAREPTTCKFNSDDKGLSLHPNNLRTLCIQQVVAPHVPVRGRLRQVAKPCHMNRSHPLLHSREEHAKNQI